jgi:prefoldin subunit 5
MEVTEVEKIIRDIFDQDEVGKECKVNVELGTYKRKSLAGLNNMIVSLQYSHISGKSFNLQHTISMVNKEVCKKIAERFCEQIKSFKNLIDTYH